MSKTLTAPVVYFKALGKADEAEPQDPLKGEYEAIVSVFGNVDQVNDRVLPGAFEEDLKAWKESGSPIPSVWSHQWDNPLAHLGVVTEAEELKAGDDRLPEEVRDLGGLYVKSTVDADLGGGQVNTYALAVLKGMREGRIREFSFAYNVLETEDQEDGANGLKALHVIEVGPCLKGINPATQLLSAKASLEGAKAGRVLSKANEDRIKQAQDLLGEVLSSLGNSDTPKDAEEEEEGKAQTKATQADESADDLSPSILAIQVEADLLEV